MALCKIYQKFTKRLQIAKNIFPHTRACEASKTRSLHIQVHTPLLCSKVNPGIPAVSQYQLFSRISSLKYVPSHSYPLWFECDLRLDSITFPLFWPAAAELEKHCRGLWDRTSQDCSTLRRETNNIIVVSTSLPTQNRTICLNIHWDRKKLSLL